jgi:two-component system, OmpR family, sensor kinase
VGYIARRRGLASPYEGLDLRDFANIIRGFLSRLTRELKGQMSSFSNNMRGGMSRFLDISFIREASWVVGRGAQVARFKASYLVCEAWRRPWPLTARVPVVSGALILAVAIAASHVLMSTVAREQEIGVRRIAAVYLDGISTTIYPHIVARNLTNTTEALRRTMWFHQSMREQRALVRLPDGSLFADVSGPNGDPGAEDPFHDAGLRQRLEEQGGFFFDTETGLGWASRAIVRNDNHVADLYVALELKPLVEERQTLRRRLLVATVLASLGASAIGFLIVRHMELPVRLLAERLRRAQIGDFDRVPPTLLPPASSEYGRLLRGYNDLVEALSEREALAARLAERERESVLGRLAATVAHEVRNPLGGMTTALDTVRKFGDDPEVRAKSLDLIERGLWSIRDVVGSVLAFHRMPADSRRLTSGDLDDLRVLIEPELARRQLQLAWHCDIQETVDVAATETRQIALNLLLNACEASPPEKEIGFRVWLDEERGPVRRTQLSLEVVDAGPGLPQEVAAALTEVGVIGLRDPPRGLGIKVVRDLVRRLGGRIVATTLAGDHGSRITVTLPTNGGTGEELGI